MYSAPDTQVVNVQVPLWQVASAAFAGAQGLPQPPQLVAVFI